MAAATAVATAVEGDGIPVINVTSLSLEAAASGRVAALFLRVP